MQSFKPRFQIATLSIDAADKDRVDAIAQEQKFIHRKLLQIESFRHCIFPGVGL